jgi:hypothetical protein
MGTALEKLMPSHSICSPYADSAYLIIDDRKIKGGTYCNVLLNGSEISLIGHISTGFKQGVHIDQTHCTALNTRPRGNGLVLLHSCPLPLCILVVTRPRTHLKTLLSQEL